MYWRLVILRHGEIAIIRCGGKSVLLLRGWWNEWSWIWDKRRRSWYKARIEFTYRYIPKNVFYWHNFSCLDRFYEFWLNYEQFFVWHVLDKLHSHLRQFTLFTRCIEGFESLEWPHDSRVHHLLTSATSFISPSLVLPLHNSDLAPLLRLMLMLGLEAHNLPLKPRTLNHLLLGYLRRVESAGVKSLIIACLLALELIEFLFVSVAEIFKGLSHCMSIL